MVCIHRRMGRAYGLSMVGCTLLRMVMVGMCCSCVSLSLDASMSTRELFLGYCGGSCGLRCVHGLVRIGGVGLHGHGCVQLGGGGLRGRGYARVAVGGLRGRDRVVDDGLLHGYAQVDVGEPRTRSWVTVDGLHGHVLVVDEPRGYSQVDVRRPGQALVLGGGQHRVPRNSGGRHGRVPMAGCA